MFVQEAECRPQAASIDELHHGKEFLQFVLDGRAGEDEGITALQLFDRSRRCGCSVADALRFVKDDQVRPQLMHVPHIFEDQFIAGESEERG